MLSVRFVTRGRIASQHRMKFNLFHLLVMIYEVVGRFEEQTKDVNFSVTLQRLKSKNNTLLGLCEVAKT